MLSLNLFLEQWFPRLKLQDVQENPLPVLKPSLTQADDETDESLSEHDNSDDKPVARRTRSHKYDKSDGQDDNHTPDNHRGKNHESSDSSDDGATSPNPRHYSPDQDYPPKPRGQSRTTTPQAGPSGRSKTPCHSSSLSSLSTGRSSLSTQDPANVPLPNSDDKEDQFIFDPNKPPE
ncbi:hypothetical protein VKT23_012439 [Stygiomarasmius scandens]|uniref:Uncharacterized protein n=1 Tax=Marasmiellus scandens TaxID=2682957 RepID=A0ABR1J6S4_9AGAR